ncbi:ABC-2 family transporter protein [Thermobacillus sp. ZCTH02-B1]|uniref:ABC-2 family transporter protein n=1 Tax=Thermobacillus sp. ZCTH02-B1 TaxID=1858795 RepID=UPI0025DAD8AC|nr:ABC-2 family transporter protein [Thermobacillus sp. ZCTH02-B1]
MQLAAGSAIAWAYMGPPAFGWGWAGFCALLPGAFTVAFLLNLAVALLAFWVEETRGMEFVLQKLNFTAGGMLLPLELMPDWLERVCSWLPFRAVLYFPARTGVAFDGGTLARFLLAQWGWAAALALLCLFMYRRGVRKLNVNGG